MRFYASPQRKSNNEGRFFKKIVSWLEIIVPPVWIFIAYIFMYIASKVVFPLEEPCPRSDFFNVTELNDTRLCCQTTFNIYQIIFPYNCGGKPYDQSYFEYFLLINLFIIQRFFHIFDESKRLNKYRMIKFRLDLCLLENLLGLAISLFYWVRDGGRDDLYWWMFTLSWVANNLVSQIYFLRKHHLDPYCFNDYKKVTVVKMATDMIEIVESRSDEIVLKNIGSQDWCTTGYKIHRITDTLIEFPLPQGLVLAQGDSIKLVPYCISPDYFDISINEWKHFGSDASHIVCTEVFDSKRVSIARNEEIFAASGWKKVDICIPE